MKGPRKIYLILISSLVLVGIVFVGTAVGIVLSLSTLTRQTKLENERLVLTEQKIKNLNVLANQLSSLKAQTDSVSKSLPTQKDSSKLVSQIEGLFCQSNPRSNVCEVQSINFGSNNLPEDLKAVALKDPNLSQSYAQG